MLCSNEHGEIFTCSDTYSPTCSESNKCVTTAKAHISQQQLIINIEGFTFQVWNNNHKASMSQCYMQSEHLMKHPVDTLSTVFIGKIHHYVREGVTEEINKQWPQKESLGVSKRSERKLRRRKKGGIKEAWQVGCWRELGCVRLYGRGETINVTNDGFIWWLWAQDCVKAE